MIKKKTAGQKPTIKNIKKKNSRHGIVIKQNPTDIVSLFKQDDIPEIITLGKNTYQLDYDLFKINDDRDKESRNKKIDAKTKNLLAIEKIRFHRYIKDKIKEINSQKNPFAKSPQNFNIAITNMKNLLSHLDIIISTQKNAAINNASFANKFARKKQQDALLDDYYYLWWKYTDVTLNGVPKPKILGLNKIDFNKLTQPVLDLAKKKAINLKRKATRNKDLPLSKELNKFSLNIRQMDVSLIPIKNQLFLRVLAIKKLKINGTIGARLIVEAYNEYYDTSIKCLQCKTPFTQKSRGRPSKFCSNKCRQKYHRRRKAGFV
jgi:hypothetical protein